MSDPNTGTQALLASLSFGLPRQSRELKREAKEIEENAHAQEGVTKASVFYFKQKAGKETIDALADLKSHFNFWKKEHDRLTLPWLGSTRFLAAAIVPAYLNMRSQMEEIAPERVAGFFEVYPDWQVTAPHRMGSLYDPEDFPAESECRERIRWECTLMPVPDGQQWQRVAMIDPDLMAREQVRHNEAVRRARAEGQATTWRDLLQHFAHITEVLSKDKVRIHETLIGGLTQMLALVPAYAEVFNDQDMLRCATEAQATLGGITAEDLRNDPAMRRQAVANAQDLLARFGALGSRRFA
jgi:hypothetical protein